MLTLARQIIQYRDVLRAQVESDIRTTVIQTRFGYLWWILDPLVLMGVYYFLMVEVLGRRAEGYQYFVFCGLVIWRWLAQSLTQATNAYSRNRGLILSLPVPLPIYVLSPILVGSFFTLIGVVLLLLVFDPQRLIYLPLIVSLMVVQGVLMFGAGMLLAASQVFFKDISKFVEYGLRVGRYLSPVIYDVGLIINSDRVDPWIKTVYQFNPFAYLLPAYRDVSLGTVEGPGWAPIGAMLLAGMLLVMLGSALTKRLRNRIPQSL